MHGGLFLSLRRSQYLVEQPAMDAKHHGRNPTNPEKQGWSNFPQVSRQSKLALRITGFRHLYRHKKSPLSSGLLRVNDEGRPATSA